MRLPFPASIHGASHQGQVYSEQLGLPVGDGGVLRAVVRLVVAPPYQSGGSCVAFHDSMFKPPHKGAPEMTLTQRDEEVQTFPP